VIVIEPRPPSPLLSVSAPLLAAIAALALAAIPIVFAGANPIDAYGYMVTGAFGSLFAFSETLTRTTPLILRPCRRGRYGRGSGHRRRAAPCRGATAVAVGRAIMPRPS
jgi:hypothetical protein